ncbi:hypothetical protein KSP35_10200 [Aquihabitans sp. G128]|uniref:hypothetical protein n=1 Tax=Aquihabitans sp. G128 TaxID=2849779 RepID=UPI001C24E0DD|nr:hypothetical protein [Aquihabitans sp. G128]QXC63112.1 hypothetical protein KSP35_10200 [Aquihabitans sp. G128]
MTDTSTSVPTDEPAPPAEASAGPPHRSGLRRAVFPVVAVALVGLAVGILVWGSKRAEVVQPTSTGNLVVVAQFPLDGGSALRQTEVGADLRQGFDGRLTINGIAIPEKEMEGVLVPGSPEAVGYTGNQLRPNNRNHVFFAPGPGKVIEKLPQGKITVTVSYFKDLQPGKDAGAESWTFEVA